MSGIGDNFQQQTKYQPDKMPGHRLVWDKKPALYKEYPDKPVIELASFEPSRPMTLDATLKQRKSVRDFQQKPITKGQLSYLLWASTGIQRIEQGYEFRTAPCTDFGGHGVLLPCVAKEVVELGADWVFSGLRDKELVLLFHHRLQGVP